MTSIIKVDTIQDQDGNNIISEAANVITIGASGDTITVPAGATVSGFTSAGIDDNATSVAITIDSSENVGIGTTSPNNYSGYGNLTLNGTSGGIFDLEVNGTRTGSLLGLVSETRLSSITNIPLTFLTNNTERMRIDSSGNVGVGTSSPNNYSGYGNITLNGTSGGIFDLGVNGTRTGTLLALVGETRLSSITNIPLNFVTNNTQRMRITSDGNVGIGTTSPTGILECKSLGNTQVYITAGNSSASELFFGDEADVDVGKVTYLHSSNAMKFQTNTNEAMRIDSSGNVGIGLTNPTAKLHVNTNSTGRSNVYFSNMNTSGGISSQEVAIGFQFNRTGGGINVSGARIVAGKEREWVGAASNQDGFLAFETCLNESVSEKMRIDSSGNLLVGKTSANTGTAGVEASPLGRIGATRSGNITGLFNRLSSDGEIVRFQKDGTTVGSIGAESGSLSVRRPTGTNGLIQTFGQPTHGIVGAIGNSSVDFYITNNYSGSTDRAGLIFTNNNKVAPAENASYSDNVTDLGSTTARFKDLYLGGGVHLGGTGSANKLDDYEEGEWTPSFSEGTGTTTASSTHTYTKIGRVVVLNGYIYNSSGATSGNDVQINGLPFTASSSRGEWKGSTTFHAVTFDTSAIITPIINGGQNYIRYTESRSGTSQDKLTYGDAGTGHFQFSITYITDA